MKRLEMISDYLINKTIVYNSVEGVIFKLSKPELKIKLSKPGAECLRILIDAQHQIISQDVLVKDIWGQKGRVVGPNTLYQHIYMLRKNFGLLGIDREIIKTTPQLGFNISTNFAIERMEDELQCAENANLPSQIESSAGWHKLFYLMPFIVSLVISLVNNPSLSNDSLSHQDGNCTLYNYPDNLSPADVNSSVRSRKNVCQNPNKHNENRFADDTICQVGKQGSLLDQTDTAF
jgi:DNA-binding winged helix-turn-helix (wHTH) protein